MTKVVLTVTFCAYQFQKGNLYLDEKVSDVLLIPESHPLFLCTVSDLLCHQSGLPAWYDFQHAHKEHLLEFLLAIPVQASIHETTCYSDVGFLLLGEFLQKKFSLTMLQMLNVLPKETRQCFFAWDQLTPEQKTKTVPTGDSKLRKNNDGIVFDDNTFFLGGLCSHAGLFGTLKGLTAFGQLWNLGTGILNKDTILRFSSKQVAKDQTYHALGWDMPTQGSTAGQHVSKQAIGHLGYTGTSIWIDQKRNTSVVLLTNRTYCQTKQPVMKKFRQEFHDLIWSLV
ncbi:MAG: serine hydrolase [Bdellovibrionales bacterium]|nr:serine hydrolase [Bdellovibrionales bacterium]